MERMAPRVQSGHLVIAKETTMKTSHRQQHFRSVLLHALRVAGVVGVAALAGPLGSGDALAHGVHTTGLSGQEFRLYELIWMRTVASQMNDARGQTVSLRLGATSSEGEDAEFGVSGTVITFPGFLAAYEEGRDEEAAEDEQRRLQDEAGSPDFYKAPPSRIREVLARIDELHGELERALARWLELEEIGR